MRVGVSLFTLLVSVSVAACGSSSSPTTPNPPPGASLTAPQAESPVGDVLLSSLRPTLTVRNGVSSQSGTRTYEFQLSDRSDFLATAPASTIPGFAATISQSGVAEGGNGRTSFTPNQDLQPATRMYWRARFNQGSVTSAWSEAAIFRTKLVGFSRAGELFDPLVHGETIGEVIGSATFIDGKGIRLNGQASYVRYRLAQSISNGEFSVEVEGLFPNGPTHKLKIFSMQDSTGDLNASNFQMSTMYRGLTGNPDNCIAFKAVFGSQSRILEPNLSKRLNSVFSLNPAQSYHWKATWGSEFRLVVQEGGIGGSTIYDYGISSAGATYNPNPAYAYLGSNNIQFGSDAGTFPGATYRNVWIGNRPRPQSLGSALTLQ